jgi:hypothetical protein
MPDATLRRAKAKAAERGIPLRQFITEAVEDKLAVPTSATKPWTKMAGKLKHLHAETVRIQKKIDDAFEQIEPEDRE